MTVYLVGAGPGDPALITVRGEALLRRADVVVHDRLVDGRLLALAPAGAELVDAGARRGAGAISQAELNELLVERGRRHGVVVRLKGGDPFVFGRGGEEAEALAAAGVAYEVVPGVSAAVGVPAYAGVPLTRRGVAASFTVVTGHAAAGAGGDAGAVDWDALGRLGGTIVALMAAAARGELAGRLIAAGRPPATPVVVVERGTLPDQRTTRTTLGSLAAVEVRAPATIVIGEVAGEPHEWLAGRPLFGWHVVVTRAREQASSLAAALAGEGAVPVELPTIAVGPPGDGGAALRQAAGGLDGFEWVVLTSANGAARLLAEVRDARAFGSAKVAAIGPGTAAALAAGGVVADLVPPEYVAESLLAAMPRPERGGASRVLLARAAAARDVLPEGLAALGYRVEVVEAYRTAVPPPDPAQLAAVAAADAITFTSSSTVTGFLEVVGIGALPPVVACIGPVTAATAREAGIAVDAVAGEHTIAGLVAALAEVAAARRPR